MEVTNKETKRRKARRGSQITNRNRKIDKSFMLFPFLDNMIAISPISSPSNQHRTVVRNSVKSQIRQRMRLRTVQEAPKQKIAHRRLKHLSLTGIPAWWHSKEETARVNHELAVERIIWDTRLPEIKQEEATSRLDIFTK